MKNSRVIVVGGGAAGLMAAGQAALCGAEVVLIEKNKKLGSKISISGKGRCNLTNAGDIRSFIDYYPGNGRFLFGALKEFDNEELQLFFNNLGVQTKVERGGRIFPETDDAEAIVEALKRFVEKNGVKIWTESSVENILVKECTAYGVKLTDGQNIEGNAVIVATGGESYPGTGSTGDGYKFAKSVGIKVISTFPALVPLKVLEEWPKKLQGLALKNVAASLWINGKKTDELFGEMLFTHFGVSGPIILTLSRNVSTALEKKQRVELKINLKPALSEEQLDQRIQRDFVKYLNKEFKNSLNDLLPKSMVPVIIKLSEINPEKKVHDISKSERKRLVILLREMILTVVGTLGLETAIVTGGGVDIKEINPSTMESKKVNGLYWAGEVIDIDGVTGGYNLQAAFSTGNKAGKSAAKQVMSVEL